MGKNKTKYKTAQAGLADTFEVSWNPPAAKNATPLTD
jgi:hypothetical protein